MALEHLQDLHLKTPIFNFMHKKEPSSYFLNSQNPKPKASLCWECGLGDQWGPLGSP